MGTFLHEVKTDSNNSWYWVGVLGITIVLSILTMPDLQSWDKIQQRKKAIIFDYPKLYFHCKAIGLQKQVQETATSHCNCEVTFVYHYRNVSVSHKIEPHLNMYTWATAEHTCSMTNMYSVGYKYHVQCTGNIMIPLASNGTCATMLLRTKVTLCKQYLKKIVVHMTPVNSNLIN